MELMYMFLQLKRSIFFLYFLRQGETSYLSTFCLFFEVRICSVGRSGNCYIAQAGVKLAANILVRFLGSGL